MIGCPSVLNTSTVRYVYYYDSWKNIPLKKENGKEPGEPLLTCVLLLFLPETSEDGIDHYRRCRSRQ